MGSFVIARFVFFTTFLLYFVKPCMAMDYIVGDQTGWNFGFNYSLWSAGKIFVVHDKLVFKYGSDDHTVEEVTKDNYETCALNNIITSYNGGFTTIILNTTGIRYFTCGVPGHCSSGMKLGVTVEAGGARTMAPKVPPYALGGVPAKLPEAPYEPRAAPNPLLPDAPYPVATSPWPESNYHITQSPQAFAPKSSRTALSPFAIFWIANFALMWLFLLKNL